jgi:hypothetical protein
MTEQSNPEPQTDQAAVIALPRSLPEVVALIRATLESWRYPRAEKRDLRLDLLRGFAVLVMVVPPVPALTDAVSVRILVSPTATEGMDQSPPTS